MSYRIFRYPLTPQEYQVIEVGWPAHLLSVARARSETGFIDLWAEVADDADREKLSREMPIPGHPIPATVMVPIYVVGTGHPMPEGAGSKQDGGFLGTVVMEHFVWHIWTSKRIT
jgi:hypothetical protein